MSTLYVIYSTDENYARHAAVSMMSLMDHNKVFENIHIYMIDNHISEISKQKMKQIVTRYHRTMEFIPMDSLPIQFEKKNDYPISSYARLFLQDALPMDKVLYLDCDTVVNDSLQSLWESDMGDNLIAGVEDALPSFLKTSIDLPKQARYVNAGVLLFHLKEWRKQNIQEKFISFINEKNGNVVHHDQGVINKVCEGKIMYLDPKYNVMPEMYIYQTKQFKILYGLSDYYDNTLLQHAISKPVVIHYISKLYHRPWFEDCTHPRKDLYLQYLEKSGFDTTLEKKRIKKRLWIRKKIEENMPFAIHCAFEKALNVRRYWKNKKEH